MALTNKSLTCHHICLFLENLFYLLGLSLVRICDTQNNSGLKKVDHYFSLAQIPNLRINMASPGSCRAAVSLACCSTTVSAQLTPQGPGCLVCFQATYPHPAGRKDEAQKYVHFPLGSFLEVAPIPTTSNWPELRHTPQLAELFLL